MVLIILFPLESQCPLIGDFVDLQNIQNCLRIKLHVVLLDLINLIFVELLRGLEELEDISP